jgi:hypothetical protein
LQVQAMSDPKDFLRNLPGAREIPDPQAEMERLAAQRTQPYYAEAVPDGEFWSIRVPAIGRTTQARSLAEIEPMTRDLIAVMTGVPAGSFGLTVTLAFPAALAQETE